MTDAPPPYPGINGYNGYASAPGAPPMAATAPQNGWYDPNNPHTAYVPPPQPAAGEMPPAYDANTKKND